MKYNKILKMIPDDILDDRKIPKVVTLLKKEDCTVCDNFRGIFLFNTGYRIYSKIVNNRLRNISHALLQEEQNGFRRGRSCIDSIFTLKQLFVKYQELDLEEHVALIDIEKAFDRVYRGKF